MKHNRTKDLSSVLQVAEPCEACGVKVEGLGTGAAFVSSSS